MSLVRQLSDALHRHRLALNREADAARWQERTETDPERSLGAIADWGPTEDWSDWVDANG